MKVLVGPPHNAGLPGWSTWAWPGPPFSVPVCICLPAKSRTLWLEPSPLAPGVYQQEVEVVSRASAESRHFSWGCGIFLAGILGTKLKTFPWQLLTSRNSSFPWCNAAHTQHFNTHGLSLALGGGVPDLNLPRTDFKVVLCKDSTEVICIKQSSWESPCLRHLQWFPLAPEPLLCIPVLFPNSGSPSQFFFQLCVLFS